MVKRGNRNCDRCKSSMNLREKKSFKAEVFNLVSLGWKNEKGSVLCKNYDLCPSCMKELDEFLRGKQKETK